MILFILGKLGNNIDLQSFINLIVVCHYNFQKKPCKQFYKLSQQFRTILFKSCFNSIKTTNNNKKQYLTNFLQNSGTFFKHFQDVIYQELSSLPWQSQNIYKILKYISKYNIPIQVFMPIQLIQFIINNSHVIQISMRILTKLFFFFAIWFAMLSQIIAKTPNPYKVLGIQRTANQDDIKQAFKKRSRKYHPDRNKTDPRAKEKFEKVVNAYQLLKDPQRRRVYDMTGQDNPQASGFDGNSGFQGQGMNVEDLLRNFGFGGMGGMGGMGGGFGNGQQRGRTTYTFSFNGGKGMRFQF